jgi:hypothetical protein
MPAASDATLFLSRAEGNLGGGPPQRPRQACLFVFLIVVQLITGPALEVGAIARILAADIFNESVEGAFFSVGKAFFIILAVLV